MFSLTLEHHFLPMQRVDDIPEGGRSPGPLPLLCRAMQAQAALLSLPWRTGSLRSVFLRTPVHSSCFRSDEESHCLQAAPYIPASVNTELLSMCQVLSRGRILLPLHKMSSYFHTCTTETEAQRGKCNVTKAHSFSLVGTELKFRPCPD